MVSLAPPVRLVECDADDLLAEGKQPDRSSMSGKSNGTVRSGSGGWERRLWGTGLPAEETVQRPAAAGLQTSRQGHLTGSARWADRADRRAAGDGSRERREVRLAY